MNEYEHLADDNYDLREKVSALTTEVEAKERLLLDKETECGQWQVMVDAGVDQIKVLAAEVEQLHRLRKVDLTELLDRSNKLTAARERIKALEAELVKVRDTYVDPVDDDIIRLINAALSHTEEPRAIADLGTIEIADGMDGEPDNAD